MVEIPTSVVVTLLVASAVLLGALVVFLPDLLEEGMPRELRVVVNVLTWASALASAFVSPVAGWALGTALTFEEAPLPRPAGLPARTEATVPETTSSAEGTIPEFTSERTGPRALHRLPQLHPLPYHPLDDTILLGLTLTLARGIKTGDKRRRRPGSAGS